MSRENESKEAGNQFIKIIEQFTDFIREKSDDDEGVKEFLPALEGLTEHLKSAAKFEEEHPAIAALLSSMCAALEEHHQKLEMLKDVIVDSGIAECRKMTKDDLAEQMLANMPKPDKDFMN